MDFNATADLWRSPTNQKESNWPVRVFDLALKKERCPSKHETLPYYVRFHPTISTGCFPAITHPQSGSGISRQERAPNSPPSKLGGRDRLASSGEMVVTGCADNKVRLWEAATGLEKAAMPGHEWSVVGVTFRADGKSLASRGWMEFCAVGSGRATGTGEQPVLGYVSEFSRIATGLLRHGAGRLGLLEVPAGNGYRVFRSPQAVQ